MRAAELAPSFCAAAAEVVRQRTGLVFTDARRPTLEAGLGRAMKRVGAKDAEAYLARLETEDAVFDDLVGEITVGETYFFRDPRQFAVIRAQILPELATRLRTGAPLRLWSAGCASGEEAYSLAMLAHELGLGGGVHVVGTDLSRAALSRALQGRYSCWSLRGVPPDLIHRYFDPIGNEVALRSPIQESVEFKYLNLAEDAYPSLSTGIWGMDLILCRNVLIYFDGDTIARIAWRLIESLGHDGWLLLGASDPLLADLVPCQVMITDAGLAYRRREVRAEHDLRRVTVADATVRPAMQPVALSPPPVESDPQGTAPVLDRSAAAGRSDELTDRSQETKQLLRAYAAGDYERAGTFASQLVRRADAGPEPWALLVRSAANRGDLETAGRNCIAGLERHPTSAELMYLHALLLAEGRRLAEAIAALRRALYLDRKLVVAHLALGHVLARADDREGARRALRNAGRLLSRTPADEIMPAADGERAGRLAEMARVQLALLEDPVRP